VRSVARAVTVGLALATSAQSKELVPPMHVTSSMFTNMGPIPTQYTCESGKEVSPPLAWDSPPEGTKSLALIVDDPDAPDPKAPKTTWVHWVVYNLPASATAIAEGASGTGAMPSGTKEGQNDWKRPGYGGPCPPIGRHRYFFKLYALDTMLGDLGRATKADLEKAMQGHVLRSAELVGTYEKTKR
jgi:Raf kinase inhibitor-like YbhB/YbcL family protein